MKEIEVRACGFSMKGIWGKIGKIIIIPDQAGVAQHLKEKLAVHGITAEISEEVVQDAAAVIFLRALDQCEHVADAMDMNKQAFLIAKDVANHYEEHGGIFVTVQRTGGDYGLRGRSGLQAWMTGLTGLTKTMALEWPATTVKAIDLDSAFRDVELCAEQIANELLFGGPEQEVGLYADGRRTTIVNEYVEEEHGAETASLLLHTEKPVIVVSGGGRGITAASIISLAKEKVCRFVLLGRTELIEEPVCCVDVTNPTQLQHVLIEDDRKRGLKRTPVEINRQVKQLIAAREITKTLATLQRLGSDVHYISLDVRHAEQVQQKLAEVRASWGAIHAIIHGSGVLADKRIVHKTEEQFDLVFDTKVKGLYSLLQATVEDSLQAIIIFSSIVSQSGNIGQADYAMANEVLNKVAAMEANKRENNCLVRSIKWGPIDGGMVDPYIKEIFSQKQLSLITVEEVTTHFLQELTVTPTASVESLICHGTPHEPQWGEMKIKQWTMEVQLHDNSQPYLLDHQVRQTVVLPIVHVLEWFYRFAKAIVPEHYMHRISNLNVKKGVLLPQFAKEGHRVVLGCQLVRADEMGTELMMSLKSQTGLVHYTATVQLGKQPIIYNPETEQLRNATLQSEQLDHIHHLLAAEDDRAIEQWQWKEQDVYDGELLFHGPAFQVIKQAYGMTSHAVAGKLKSNRTTHWRDQSGASWYTVPDILDGGMQISRLWAIQYHELPFLPMSIGSFIMYEPMTHYDELVCIAKCDTVGKLAAKGDMYFYNASGQLIAEMTGVQGFRVSEGDE